MNDAVQIIVLLRIKAPGRAIPTLGQVVDLSVEKKIDSRLVPESVFPTARIQKINRGLEKMLSPEFVEIHQQDTAVKVNAFRRKIHRLCHNLGVVRKRQRFRVTNRGKSLAGRQFNIKKSR